MLVTDDGWTPWHRLARPECNGGPILGRSRSDIAQPPVWVRPEKPGGVRRASRAALGPVERDEAPGKAARSPGLAAPGPRRTPIRSHQATDSRFLVARYRNQQAIRNRYQRYSPSTVPASCKACWSSRKVARTGAALSRRPEEAHRPAMDAIYCLSLTGADKRP